MKLHNKIDTPSSVSPLTVMLLIDLLDKMGGAERNLYLLSKELRTRGYKVIICSLQSGEMSKKLHQEGFHVEDLNLIKIYDFKGLKALIRMIRLVNREKVSVIMSYHKSSDYLGLVIAKLARVPIISSRRDMGFQLRTRHIWLYRLMNRFYDQIIAVSESVEEFIVKSQWSKPSDVTVIPNGVELDSNPCAPLERMNGFEFVAECLNICCLANIRPIKGQKHLIDAVSFIANRIPTVRFFLVGGHGPDTKYYEDVKRRVKDLNLQNTVNFTGQLPNELIPAFLASMDISVLPSLSEGMSNALLESMAMGKPVIATNIGGNPEVVVDGKTGYLVPAENPHAMAEALLKLINDPQLRHDMGRQARSHVESKFSINRMLERHEDVFQYVSLKRETDKFDFLLSCVIKAVDRIRWLTKIFVANISYYSGLVLIYRWAKRAFGLGRVKILCLHDVSDLAEKHSIFSISISPTHFVKFLNYLAQNYHVVGLQEAVNLQGNWASLTDDVFALTFDDCYKGWVKYVLPECQRLQLPLATFLATEPLDTRKPLLYDALIFLAQNTWRKVADLSPWQMGVYLLANSPQIYRFVQEIHHYWHKRNKEDRDRFLQELSEYLGVSLNSHKCQSMLLNWDDVSRLDTAGVTIGAHGVSHNRLDYLSLGECISEIYDCKKTLEYKIGRTIKFFAYPYGIIDQHKTRTTRVLRMVGFSYAFILTENKTDTFRPFEIPRRSVSNGMFQNFSGKFHKPLLATELCGLGDILFGRLLFQSMKRAKPSYPH